MTRNPRPEKGESRTIFVDREEALPPGSPPRPLDRVLRDLHPGASWNEVRRLVNTGKIRVDGAVARDPSTLVAPPSVIAIRMTSRRPDTSPLGADALVFVDAQVVVVRKPPGIATVPFEDERDTLDRLVHSLVKKTVRHGPPVAPLGVVQRLDKETSGLLVFTRTATAKQSLQQQLRDHTVHRRYLALAHGDVPARTIRSRLVQDRGDGIRGSTRDEESGRESVTRVRVLEALAGATLVECALETGRTHQIRIHLSEVGHPLLGERVYVRGFPGRILPAPRVMLHAAELGFDHPSTGERLHFSDPPPDDFVSVLRRLGR